MGRNKRIAALLTAMLLLVGCSGAESAGSGKSVTAAEMRLAKAKGSVALSDENGVALPVQLNMRLYHGNGIATETESRAGISLDSAKSATVGQESAARIRRSGGDLALDLEKGELILMCRSRLAQRRALRSAPPP